MHRNCSARQAAARHVILTLIQNSRPGKKQGTAHLQWMTLRTMKFYFGILLHPWSEKLSTDPEPNEADDEDDQESLWIASELFADLVQVL